MSNESYNGWTNYETWLVKLWMDNDEGSYRHYRDIVRNCGKDEAYSIGKQIQEEIEEGNPIGSDASLFSDMLSAGLRVVN